MHRVLIVSVAILALTVAAARVRGGQKGPNDVPSTVYRCQYPFCTKLDESIRGAIATRAAPSMAMGVINSSSGPELYVGAAGHFTYDSWTAVTTNETRYDMASCTKIMATTTATAFLYQAGYIGLDERVASPRLLGPAFASHGKGEITIRNLMLHNAGFPPDPNPGYSSPTFPCPQNANYHPGQDFSCYEAILNNLLYNQTLINPTGAVFVYSDLSMITMMFVIGKVVRDNKLVDPSKMVAPCFDPSNLICNYLAYVTINIFQRYDMIHTGFVPSDPQVCTPQWHDPWYHHGQIMGYVSDQNAYAMGGIAGHAGVFSSVEDALKLMRVWMYDTDPKMLNKTTMTLFTTVANLTQSSRALGWDTNNQAYRWCGTMSNATFLHIGYTGTELCGDPQSGLATIVLANGRYPDFSQSGMIQYRPIFNTLVNDLYHGYGSSAANKATKK